MYCSITITAQWSRSPPCVLVRMHQSGRFASLGSSSWERFSSEEFEKPFLHYEFERDDVMYCSIAEVKWRGNCKKFEYQTKKTPRSRIQQFCIQLFRGSLMLRLHCTGSLFIRYMSVPFPRIYTVPVQFQSSAGTILFLFPSRYKT